MRRFHFTALLSAALLAVGLVAAPAAQADSVSPDPPGANDFTCKPSAVHPYPVVLVPGTFETMYKNWALLSPALKDQGYCVFSLNYGVVNGVPASGPVKDSAAELGQFVSSVLGATGAKLMTTMLNELERRGGRYGLQTMCEGGGQANVTIIERL